MATLTVQIIFDRAALSLLNWAGQAELERQVIQPELVHLANKLMDSAREELGPPIRYHGDMERGLGARREGTSEAVVTQTALHDQFVRDGTAGPYKGFPVPVKTWAMTKLGLPPEQAGAIATRVQQYGTSDFFERHYYPIGHRGFKYAEYIVVQKELDEIQQAAMRIGALALQYALGKVRGNP
jgi:hypothetical protein